MVVITLQRSFVNIEHFIAQMQRHAEKKGHFTYESHKAFILAFYLKCGSNAALSPYTELKRKEKNKRTHDVKNDLPEVKHANVYVQK